MQHQRLAHATLLGILLQHASPGLTFSVLPSPQSVRPCKRVSSHRLGESRSSRSELWKIERIDRTNDWTDSAKTYPSPLALKPNIPKGWFIDPLRDAVAAKVQVDALESWEDSACFLSDEEEEEEGDCEFDRGQNAEAFVLAGPRAEIAYDTEKCKAAVVTCGGLCPGLNTVIREVVVCLRRQYGVNEVYGIPAGYRGFKSPETWRLLDEEAVRNIHNQGGSILGSSRGGHDTFAIVDSLVAKEINLLFVVGGDGTVKGAARIAEEVKNRGLEISVAVVPKTIDNDVPLLDRTFGFETAVSSAREAIDVANTEAEGFPNGLGVVKVMGRNSGFIAMHSALGSCVVDLCLVPEVDFFLDGPGGIVDHLYERIRANDKAVVVVAEGAGQKLMAAMGAAGETVTDASGNILLDDIGPWLCRQLKTRLDPRLEEASDHGDKLTLKYLDPSYSVRGIPPLTADNLYCLQLAHNAVHGAMAGMTNFLVGAINTRECYIPIPLVADKRNVIDTRHQSLWETLVFATGQPSFQREGDDAEDFDALTTASGGVVLPN